MVKTRTVGLREFIEEEMRRRDMTANQFADFVGVAHTTIGRAIDQRRPTTPSPEFLIKLAKATGISLSSLIALVIPEAEHIEVSARSLLIAERIGQLPPDKQEIIDSLILSWLFEDKDRAE